jgi:hypothetical protein
MADDKPTGPVEMGAEMDYAEHDKTYHRFLTLAKFSSLVCGALLAAMAFAFFTTAGFSRPPFSSFSFAQQATSCSVRAGSRKSQTFRKKIMRQKQMVRAG